MKNLGIIITFASGIFLNFCAGHSSVHNAREAESILLTNMDVEIKISVTGGLMARRGLIVARKANKWSATYFPPSSDGSQANVAVDVTGSHDNWSDLIHEFERLGVFEAKNESDIKNEIRFNDGQVVTIEYDLGSERRGKYSCSEPCAQETGAGKNLCAVVNNLAKYTGIKLMNLPEI